MQIAIIPYAKHTASMVAAEAAALGHRLSGDRLSSDGMLDALSRIHALGDLIANLRVELLRSARDALSD